MRTQNQTANARNKCKTQIKHTTAILYTTVTIVKTVNKLCMTAVKKGLK